MSDLNKKMDQSYNLFYLKTFCHKNSNFKITYFSYFVEISLNKISKNHLFQAHQQSISTKNKLIGF